MLSADLVALAQGQHGRARAERAARAVAQLRGTVGERRQAQGFGHLERDLLDRPEAVAAARDEGGGGVRARVGRPGGPVEGERGGKAVGQAPHRCLERGVAGPARDELRAGEKRVDDGLRRRDRPLRAGRDRQDECGGLGHRRMRDR